MQTGEDAELKAEKYGGGGVDDLLKIIGKLGCEKYVKAKINASKYGMYSTSCSL
jgi:hypothetical protein